MSLFRSIKNALFPVQKKSVDDTFIFPYSEDKEMKRQEIWSNLEKGLLFEDMNLLIPWSTPFSDLDKFAEHREDRGDRTNWSFGKHCILDGYECSIGVMKWSWIHDTNPFSQIDAWLGFDDAGCERFLFLKERLTELLGEPDTLQLKKFDDLDLGTVEWRNKNVQVLLIGIEQFACKYWLKIGLKDHKNF